jgi:hypothetical protein
MKSLLRLVAAALALAVGLPALAQPSSVTHTPGDAVFSVAGATQRTPLTPRDGEAVTIYFRVCCQFTYDRVAVYYTTSGATPGGSFGSGTIGTLVLTGGSPAGPVTFVANETTGGQTYDWWRATLPAGFGGETLKYKLSAWKPGVGSEVFANGGAAYSYSVKLAWPGAGAGQASPGTGYPPVSFWKEEAVFGNTFTAGMLDQNGTVYDMHFPTPGGVFGVGTRNEGYVDHGDTFPALLPAGWRGQMHINQAMPGIRVNGTTHWLSNPNGVSYDQVTQSYNPTSNTIHTTGRLFAGGANIAVEQYDFSPAGIAFPNNTSGQPERHIYIKRLILTAPAAARGTTAVLPAQVYWYVDPALNGGDTYDSMFWDASKGAMTAYDKTTRTVTGTGNSFASPDEYNPTTNAGYTKNIALYLSSCVKLAGSNTLAAESWRDSSGDNGQGWMGTEVLLEPGVPTEIDILMVGSSYRPPNPLTDPMPSDDGVYNGKIAPVLDWFRTANIASVQSQTDAYWANWLNSGTRAATPDANVNKLMDRGLLCTALHVDGFNGGVIAGFHNGAYPYVWPRDAVYAAITLARTGHLAEAEGVYAYMKNTTYRDFEAWGRKGFWKQKYSTDGYVIWGAPQIDETAVLPWGVNFQYRMTADSAMLNRYVEQVRDSVLSCTQSSGDSRLFVVGGGNACSNDSPGLMHSNNVWEDSYATFVYSNANIVRGLWDAASIYDALGLTSERDDANLRAASFKAALDARLACNAENTDISQLGVVYPFKVYSPLDSRVGAFESRITSQLVNAPGLFNDGYGWTGLVNRYTGDGYWGNGSGSSPWGAGPWFLSTAWYGLYFAERADLTPGKADINLHKAKIDAMLLHVGPNGLGSEQIAPRGIAGQPAPWNTGSLLYPGQNDFTLETAWPNAWESMSTFVDSVMAFLDYEPDAASNTMHISPKLPTGWTTMTFSNVTLVNTPLGRTNKVNVAITEVPATGNQTLTYTNISGFAVGMQPTLKLPVGRSACSVRVNGAPVGYTPDVSGRLTINSFPLAAGAAAVTTLVVTTVVGSSPDFNHTGALEVQDIFDFLNAWFAGSVAADFNGGGLAVQDIFDFLSAWFAGC